MATSSPFTFPLRAEVERAACAALLADAPEVEGARRRGYEEGLTDGGDAARRALNEELTAARAQACAEGRRDGLVALEGLIAALNAALSELDALRNRLRQETEAFAVELALAALERIAQVDEVRSDFVRNAIAAGVKSLGAQPLVEIVLNSTDAAQAGSALPAPLRVDESLAPGTVRIDGGRLLVESALEDALDAIRTAVFTTRARRARGRRA